MKFVKKLVIMTGSGAEKGTFSVEKNAAAVSGRVNIHNLRPLEGQGYLLVVICNNDTYFVEIGSLGTNSRTFVLPFEADVSTLHCALVAGEKVVLYGTTEAKRMWEGNIIDILRRKTLESKKTDVTQPPKTDTQTQIGDFDKSTKQKTNLTFPQPSTKEKTDMFFPEMPAREMGGEFSEKPAGEKISAGFTEIPAGEKTNASFSEKAGEKISTEFFERQAGEIRGADLPVDTQLRLRESWTREIFCRSDRIRQKEAATNTEGEGVCCEVSAVAATGAKKNINDYFLDIITDYNDEAVAEVNYFCQEAPHSRPELTEKYYGKLLEAEGNVGAKKPTSDIQQKTRDTQSDDSGTKAAKSNNIIDENNDAAKIISGTQDGQMVRNNCDSGSSGIDNAAVALGGEGLRRTENLGLDNAFSRKTKSSEYYDGLKQKYGYNKSVLLEKSSDSNSSNILPKRTSGADNDHIQTNQLENKQTLIRQASNENAYSKQASNEPVGDNIARNTQGDKQQQEFIFGEQDADMRNLRDEGSSIWTPSKQKSCNSQAQSKLNTQAYPQPHEQIDLQPQENTMPPQESTRTKTNAQNTSSQHGLQQQASQAANANSKSQETISSEENPSIGVPILEAVSTLGIRKAPNLEASFSRIRLGTFYEQIKEQLDSIFKTYPRNAELETIIPDSKWAKVDYNGDGKFYVIGVIGKPDYICYGVPAAYTPTPPPELADYCQWLPLDIHNPTAKGYWLLFQDAVSGESIKNEII